MEDGEDYDPLPALAEYFVVAGIAETDSKGKRIEDYASSL